MSKSIDFMAGNVVESKRTSFNGSKKDTMCALVRELGGQGYGGGLIGLRRVDQIQRFIMGGQGDHAQGLRDS
jgi:hypothetical protein